MRRFRVYVNSSGGGDSEIVELPDDVTEEQIAKKCGAAMDALLSNLDSGWHELEEEDGE